MSHFALVPIETPERVTTGSHAPELGQLADGNVRPFIQLRVPDPGERAKGVQCVQVPSSVCTPDPFNEVREHLKT